MIEAQYVIWEGREGKKGVVSAYRFTIHSFLEKACNEGEGREL